MFVIRKEGVTKFSSRFSRLLGYIPESVWASDLTSCTMLFNQLPVDPKVRCQYKNVSFVTSLFFPEEKNKMNAKNI